MKNNKLPLGRSPGQKLRFSYEFWEQIPRFKCQLYMCMCLCVCVSGQAAGTLPQGPIHSVQLLSRV